LTVPEKQGNAKDFILVYGESFISESFSIQPELLYSQQGYEIKDANGTFTQKLDYINLPIPNKSLSSKKILEAGPNRSSYF
jgi:hypothetical protein